jgi:hypothetical protein
MHPFDRKTTALLIVAVFCRLPTAGAGPPADKAGTGGGIGVEARIETFTAEQKAHWSYQPLKQRPKKRLGHPRLAIATDCARIPYAAIGIM